MCFAQLMIFLYFYWCSQNLSPDVCRGWSMPNISRAIWVPGIKKIEGPQIFLGPDLKKNIFYTSGIEISQHFSRTIYLGPSLVGPHQILRAIVSTPGRTLAFSLTWIDVKVCMHLKSTPANSTALFCYSFISMYSLDFGHWWLHNIIRTFKYENIKNTFWKRHRYIHS